MRASTTGLAALAVALTIASTPSAMAATGHLRPQARTATAAVAAPVISAPPDVVVGEADGFVDLPVTLSAPGERTVTVDYQTADGTASGEFDSCEFANSAYEDQQGTLTFTPGETSQTVDIALLNCQQSLSSGFLTFYLRLSSNSDDSSIARAATQVDITGDQPAASTPGLYARDAMVDASAGTVDVPVVLGGPSGAAQAVPVTVSYATHDGSAKAGTDYRAESGTLTFNPGQTARNIVVPILHRAGMAGARSFSVTLSSPANATVAYGTGVVTIGASGGTAAAAPGIYAPPDVVVGESDGYVDLPVTLRTPGQSTVTVVYQTADGTASGEFDSCEFANSAYADESGTLTFAPGVTTQVVRVPLLNCQQSLSSGFLTFYLRLSSNSDNSSIGRAVTQVDITGDQAAAATPGLYVRDATVDASAGTVDVPVLLGGPSGAAQGVPVTVSYATHGYSARAGTDFAATTGTLTFAPGETAQNIVVPILDRAGRAAARSFSVTLGTPSNATAADGTGVVTIGASGGGAVASPFVNGPPNLVAGEADGYVDLPVTLSAPGDRTVTVDYQTADGTASGEFDSCEFANSAYADESGTLTFAPGVTTQVVRVPLLNCDTGGPLNFAFTLDSPVNAAIASGNATITIFDPARAPGAPTRVTATAGVKQATVAFAAPVSNGGDSIDYYTVTASPGGATASGTSSPIVVTGLADGTAYTFKVTASNPEGTGSASAASPAVVPGLVPKAPTALSAVAGNHKVSLSWKAPAGNSGPPVQGYDVYVGTSPGHESSTAVNGSLITAATYVVSGLTDGTEYYFAVQARNVAGGSPNSTQASATPSPVTFHSRPGTATDISVGANGAVWDIGTGNVSGGHPVYRLSGSTWVHVGGAAAVVISVDRHGDPWIVNSSHHILHWSGAKWVSVAGSATDISAGAGGSVWDVGTGDVSGGHPVYRRSGSKWVRVAGAAVVIAVDQHGDPWIVNSGHDIAHWSGSKFVAVAGAATDISVGADGAVWDIGTDNVSGGHSIYQRNGSGWTEAAGGAVTIAVNPYGNPWIVTVSHQIYFG